MNALGNSFVNPNFNLPRDRIHSGEMSQSLLNQGAIEKSVAYLNWISNQIQTFAAISFQRDSVPTQPLSTEKKIESYLMGETMDWYVSTESVFNSTLLVTYAVFRNSSVTRVSEDSLFMLSKNRLPPKDLPGDESLASALLILGRNVENLCDEFFRRDRLRKQLFQQNIQNLREISSGIRRKLEKKVRLVFLLMKLLLHCISSSKTSFILQKMR